MGAFYIDEDGKVFEGEKPPVDGSEPSELDVKEYKFFIDEISADKTEIRLATQAINSDKYKDEFNNLLYPGGVYTPETGYSGDIETGIVMDGRGRFKSEGGAGFEFDTKASTDLGFLKNYQGGILQVEKAFITGYTPIPNINENSSWSLEDPIPVITIESNYPDKNVTTNTPITFTAKRESGNIAPSQLSYYWDFGCGHQEFGGPEITHTYTISGNMNVSIVINSPNFVDTVEIENPIIVEVGENILTDEVSHFESIWMDQVTFSVDSEGNPISTPNDYLNGRIKGWESITGGVDYLQVAGFDGRGGVRIIKKAAIGNYVGALRTGYDERGLLGWIIVDAFSKYKVTGYYRTSGDFKASIFVGDNRDVDGNDTPHIWNFYKTLNPGDDYSEWKYFEREFITGPHKQNSTPSVSILRVYLYSVRDSGGRDLPPGVWTEFSDFRIQPLNESSDTPSGYNPDVELFTLSVQALNEDALPDYESSSLGNIIVEDNITGTVVNYGVSGTTSFLPGTSVTLRAEPTSKFVNWIDTENNVLSSGPDYTFSIDGNVSINGVFTPSQSGQSQENGQGYGGPPGDLFE
jgi:hypothetical protein